MGSFNRARGAAISLTLALMLAMTRPDGHLWQYQRLYLGRPHQSQVKPQKVHAIRSVAEIHDPGLVRMEAQFQGSRGALEPSEGALRIGFRPTQDHGIVREANAACHVMHLLRPEGVEGVAVDIGEQRGNRKGQLRYDACHPE